jgi:hypothetical protein
LTTNACAQINNTLSKKKSNSIDSSKQLLIGKWQAEYDHQFKILFTTDRYIEIYGKDTVSNTTYRLSNECNDLDSLHENNLSQDNISQGYIIIQPNGYRPLQCNEILNLERNFFTFTVGDSGRTFTFKKLK